MRIDLRTAALTPSEEQKTRIAVGLLGGVRIDANVSPWNGERCDVVVVNADDFHGQQIMVQAQRRGIAMVVYAAKTMRFELPTQCHVADSTVAALVSALRGVIAASEAGRPAVRVETGGGAPNRATNFSALTELTYDAWRGRDVDAEIGGRHISIRASRGRVIARTLSDMLAARDALGNGAEPHHLVAALGHGSVVGEVSWSLDVFLVEGALRCRRLLPTFHGHAFALRDWPDLGCANETVAPLRIANWLQQRIEGLVERAQSAGISADEVNACLWAFRASDLLVVAEPTERGSKTVSQRAPGSISLLSKIAARFGLAW